MALLTIRQIGIGLSDGYHQGEAPFHGWIVARAHKDLCNPIAMLSLASCRGGAFRHASTWGVSATSDPHGVDRCACRLIPSAIRPAARHHQAPPVPTNCRRASADHLPELSRPHRRGEETESTYYAWHGYHVQTRWQEHSHSCP